MVDFNAGTLPDIAACIALVGRNVNRGTLSATSKPTYTDVQNWLVRAKQELSEAHGFTWRRVFVYMDTKANEYRYAFPADFGEGGHVIRDISNDIRLTYIDPVLLDSMFPDIAGSSSTAPGYYTVKDREMWLSQPASGVYRLELEYDRSGDDSSTIDISYLPELMRFKICDYATYRAFLVLQMWPGVNAYKAEWETGIGKTKVRDTKKRWKAMGYKVRPFLV